MSLFVLVVVVGRGKAESEVTLLFSGWKRILH